MCKVASVPGALVSPENMTRSGRECDKIQVSWGTQSLAGDGSRLRAEEPGPGAEPPFHPGEQQSAAAMGRIPARACKGMVSP